MECRVGRLTSSLPSSQSWQFSANSIHYLLGFWQRLVGSVPYIRSTEPHLLDTYMPEVGKTRYRVYCSIHLPSSSSQITSAYITSRLEAMESVVRDNLDNPLDDNTIVSQQLDQMATIGR